MKHKLVVLALLCSMMPFIMAPGEPPPPPPEPVDCSPGYWKNHTEIWMGRGCGTASGRSDAMLLDMLSPQGARGSRQDRETAQRILNNCPGLNVNCSD